MPAERHARLLANTDRFVDRHIGPRERDIEDMLSTLGLASLDELIEKTVPAAIRTRTALDLPPARDEAGALAELRALAERNQVFRSLIGMGYSGTLTPPVIQRTILENPGWYTQYTPYQAEIAQGRLEALLNYQTLVADLTGLPVSNASLLDEGTAAAEAMTLCHRAHRGADGAVFFVSDLCHPQTIAVVQTRARPLGIEVVVADHRAWDFSRPTFGALVQYPATTGEVFDYTAFGKAAHAHGALFVVAADILALTILRSPAEIGADVAVGNTQRFGVPLGFGGPHAAYMAARDDFKRQLPGRIIGLSRDAQGGPALRLALQTREQHIRREKATSNICTAQVLLAVIASMYAVYHGPQGLAAIGRRVRHATLALRAALAKLGYDTGSGEVFDTLRVAGGPRDGQAVLAAAAARRINLRAQGGGAVGVSLDERTDVAELQALYEVFGGSGDPGWEALAAAAPEIPEAHRRQGAYLQHPVFARYHSETELLRYIKALEARDLSLAQAMIPLGSCTMKLNAAAEMYPISWPGFSDLHPFAPPEQTLGYQALFAELGRRLSDITGFAGCSFQPNAGSQGEYTGLLVIRAYHAARGEAHRDVCLIPSSAHGTNPASATLAGMEVVVTRCDHDGNIDPDDLEEKAAQYRDRLAAAMITYPSTHGVFEEGIRHLCEIVHGHGGQVYIDGANMNALVGLARIGEFGGDVCHINLHKTFCIPHGGGGPGMGPICVAKHLVPFLPGHPVVATGGERAVGAVSAAPWGSASILPIPFAYISMMGAEGLKRATEVAILNANYVARRLDPHFPVLYRGRNGFIAHECIVDLRPLKATSGVEADDVAKRLMDYGFHAPTMSFPVPGTLMIEPTESESKEELDRFVEALVAIRQEIREIEEGRADRADNLLKNAPHTAAAIAAQEWTHAYTREQAAFPTRWTRERKFWPASARVDNVYGDRNLVCACPPVSEYA